MAAVERQAGSHNDVSEVPVAVSVTAVAAAAAATGQAQGE